MLIFQLLNQFKLYLVVLNKLEWFFYLRTIYFYNNKKLKLISAFLASLSIIDNLTSLNHLDEVNIVFNDIDCSPYYFFAILKWLIPRTKTASYFIIDRGATYWPNYCAMELSIEQLNSGKIPKVLYDIIDNKPQFQELIKRFKFSTQYVLKTVNQGSDQDSFAILKIEDCNVGYF